MIMIFNEHRHRYAIWTVARAQRAFAKNKEITDAIEYTDLRKWVERNEIISQDDFDVKHTDWCNALTMHFSPKPCEYGRAAKMIAIYLKTAVVLPANGESQLCGLIHPPIDRVLLQRLAKKTTLRHFKTINWTTTNHETYWTIVRDIKNSFGFCNWKIEAFWTLTNDE
jgi:hypothetical protein